MPSAALLDSGQPDAGGALRVAEPLAARLAHELGRYDLERELLGLSEGVPVGAVAPMQRAEAALMRARLAAVEGDDRAGDRYSEAITELRTSGTPYHLAHGLLDHALFLGPDDPRSHAATAEAATIAERLKCPPLLARSVQLFDGASPRG